MVGALSSSAQHPQSGQNRLSFLVVAAIPASAGGAPGLGPGRGPFARAAPAGPCRPWGPPARGDRSLEVAVQFWAERWNLLRG